MASNLPLGWSELIPDVLSLVYERLSFPDIARAKSVCLSWYSVSTPRKNHVPWLIFKQNRNWKLFDPEEGKFYKAQINHFGFKDCRSLATCGSWVLVLDNEKYLYIVNPFTSNIIRLPPLESDHTLENKILGKFSIQFDYGRFKKGRQCRAKGCYGLRRSVEVTNAVLWVDERARDYLVVWASRDGDQLRFCMKGDEEWLGICEYLGDEDQMVYKDKKLYIFKDDGRIKILDFSQDFPTEVPNHPYVNRRFHTDYGSNKMRLTKSGDILIIRQMPHWGGINQFEVCKMNSTTEEWEIVDSFDEEEALVWDFCDYYWDFCDDTESSYLKSSTYKILLQRIERFRDLRGVSDDRWLLPCFGFEE